MSVDVFLLINLLALFHRNTALPARIPSSGRAPRTSCAILKRKPRLPKLHSCFPTDPDSIRLPSSVLTAPLGLLYSAVVPKGAFSIETNLNLRTLWSPPLVPTSAVLKLAGSIPIQDADNAERVPACRPSAGHSVPQCRPVPAYGRALRAQCRPTPCPSAGQCRPSAGTPVPQCRPCRPSAGHSVPQCRPSAGTPCPSAGQCRPALPCPSAGRAGLRPGTPWPSAGLRPVNGFQCPVHCSIVCILGARYSGPVQRSI